MRGVVEAGGVPVHLHPVIGVAASAADFEPGDEAGLAFAPEVEVAAAFRIVVELHLRSPPRRMESPAPASACRRQHPVGGEVDGGAVFGGAQHALGFGAVFFARGFVERQVAQLFASFGFRVEAVEVVAGVESASPLTDQ